MAKRSDLLPCYEANQIFTSIKVIDFCNFQQEVNLVTQRPITISSQTAHILNFSVNQSIGDLGNHAQITKGSGLNEKVEL